MFNISNKLYLVGQIISCFGGRKFMANIKLVNEKKIIPIFYACDDAFVKYTIVSIKSLMENASKDRFYKIYVLNTKLSCKMKEEAEELSNDNFEVIFVDIRGQVEKTSSSLPLRDYYSKTTYFRLYIADLYPEYDKAIYIDSDTIVLGDVSKMYDTDIGNNYVGACNEQAMVQTEVYGNYVEKVMGIDRNNYFNAGVLLINCKQFRENKVLEQFLNLLEVYSFVVTQDEDYLNVICHNKVYWLDQGWNTEVYGEIPVKEEDMKIIHYIMVAKPWHFRDCKYQDYFWKYAKQTSVYEEILEVLNSYTDEQREKDFESGRRLAETAKQEALRIDSYINLVNSKAPDRLKVLEKIRKYEIEKKFDVDVENDPETIVLTPDMVDYLGEKASTRFWTKIANRVATNYYEKQIKKGNFIIKEINGLENYTKVNQGAFITCNHFHPNDNYAIWRSIKKEFKRGKRLYKVIREGNYTNFKGLFGFMFRHCNTLPLSSNTETMKKFLRAVETLISRGEKILIYPEQAMWWNYKKPRPLKNGAFKFAAKYSAPIIPAFITMEDSDKIGQDGFNIQAYTVWFLPAIYPKKDLSVKENTLYLKEENFKVWKELYEKVYGVPLKYGE